MRFSRFMMVTVFLAAPLFTSKAGEVPLTNITDLIANSTWDGVSQTLQPNSNGYRVAGDIDVSWWAGSWQSGNLVLDSAGTNLSVNDLGTADDFELSTKLYNKNVYLGDGNIYVTGGMTKNGLTTLDFYTLAGKSGNVYASSGDNRSNGIEAWGNFTHEGSGTVTGQGGHLNGIHVWGNFTTQGASGDVIANGGKGVGDGISVNGNFIHGGQGQILATGSAAADASGLASGGIATMGNFETTGASGNVVANGNLGGGIFVFGGSLDHRGSGEIVASGGSDGATGRGIFVGTGSFNAYAGSGKVTAVGGVDSTSGWGVDGIGVGHTMFIDTTLEISRTGPGHSVYVGNFDPVAGVYGGINDVGLTFGPNAVLVPVVDFSKPDDLASGLIHLAAGTIQIDPGATLAPELHNTASLQNNAERTIRFIEAGNQITPNAADAQIVGEFQTLIKPTLTFNYEMEAVVEKNDAGYNKTYVLKFGRTITPGQVVRDNGYCSENTRRMLDAMHIGLAGVTTPEAANLNALYDAFATFTDPLDLAKYATYLSTTLNPQAFTRLTAFSLREEDAAQYNLLGRMSSFGKYYATADRNGYDQQLRNWTLWADGLYQKSWRHESISCGFTDTDEDFGGVALGAAKTIGGLTLGGQAHYLRGNVKGEGNNIDSDTYGFLLSARYDFLPRTGNVVPWLSAVGGYSYLDHSQNRRDALNYWHKSSPDADLVRLGMAAGVDVLLGGGVTLTPQVGLDYTHLNQKSYRENNGNDLGLSVSPDDVNSLRPFIGVDVDAKISEKFSLTARAKYRYETGDRCVNVDSSFVSVPSVRYRFEGEKVNRSSGTVGAGIKYQITERANLGVNYDLWIEDHYTGHQFTLGAGVVF